jgi:hypothetical protein
MSSAAISVKRSVPAPVAQRNHPLACRPTLLRVQISFQGPSADVAVGVIHIAVDNLLALSRLQLLSAALRTNSWSFRGGELYFIRRVVVNLFSSTRFFFSASFRFRFRFVAKGGEPYSAFGSLSKTFFRPVCFSFRAAVAGDEALSRRATPRLPSLFFFFPKLFLETPANRLEWFRNLRSTAARRFRACRLNAELQRNH